MAALQTFLFTSESVNEGHPDKLADQVRPLVRVRASWCCWLPYHSCDQL